MDNESNVLAGLALAAAIGLGLFFISSTNAPDAIGPNPSNPVNPIPQPPPPPAPPPLPPPKPEPPCPNCPRAADDAGYQPVGLGNEYVEKCLCCGICLKDSCRCGGPYRVHCWEGCYCNEKKTGSYDAAVDGESHDGTEISCPLPPDFHTKNVGGSNGAGLCVFCSMHHSGVWADEPVFAAIFDWMKKHPGGGWPEKVTKMVKQCAQELHLPEPEYIQVTGKDLTVLKEACRLGRMPGVTYSFSPTGRYHGARISHMVSLVHADDKWFVILDNNYVTGEKHLEWLSPDEFLKTYSPGWAIIPLKPGPPFPPSN